MRHLATPVRATPGPTRRAWLVMAAIITAIIGTVAVLVATSSGSTDPLPACRISYLVGERTMVVPQLDDHGFVTGYDTQQCEPAR